MSYDRQKILETDRKHVWHPFTQQKMYEKIDPVIIVRGEGLFLYDDAGNQYYDTISSWWVNLLGHTNKRVSAAMKKQLDTLEHVNFSGFTHPYATGLIDELREMIPEVFTRYFFSDNGSTAVEVAIKMAFQYWVNKGIKGKNSFIMLNNSYHGDTLGATSVGAVDLYHATYKPLMFDTIRVTAPYEVNPTEDYTFDAMAEYDSASFEPMRKAMEENKNSVAAVIVEPILQGAGGMKIYHPEYLNDLRKCADEHNILIICDEVATGFGRTGELFAFMHAKGFKPDIFAISKAITAGFMPLALTVTTEDVYNSFYGDIMKTFFHGHSYTANPLACAAAIETMHIIKENNYPHAKHEVMEHFHSRLRELQQFDFVGDIRYKGFVGAIDIVKSRKDKTPFDSNRNVGFEIYQESLKHGLVLRPLGNVIYWWLPMIVERADIDIIINKSIEVIERVISR
ncbi:adenosylmethionine--8-amino-7-oxononanoate transaminase [bacterium]|nr:adenosylmethionine--8-amino-7-oxononanoate transaminase [bacterium]